MVNISMRVMFWQFLYVLLELMNARQVCGGVTVPCSRYAELSAPDRYIGYENVDGNVTCDSGIVNQWYRFIGLAGSSMSENCPPTYRCKANAPGWLEGSHPAVEDGEVTRKVCFTWNGNCCNWSSNIQVVNCGDFYVYKLVSPDYCQSRYCGDHDIDECAGHNHDCDKHAVCNNIHGSFRCNCNQGYKGDGRLCEDENECESGTHNCDANAQCSNTIGSFTCACLQGYSGNGLSCSDIDECAKATHNCHGMALCNNTMGSFNCVCRNSYTGNGLDCQPIGDFTVTIVDISKYKNNATVIRRSLKSVQQAIIQGFPEDFSVLESVLQWHLVSEEELFASESAEGTLESEGSTEWQIGRRSIPAGIYQVRFTASFKIGDSVAPRTIQAFNYGFIEVISAPLRAIIDGGSNVRWGSAEIVTVDGSLSYDGDIGPGNHTGVGFIWSCRDAIREASVSNDCFGAFVDGENAVTVRVDTSKLTTEKTYVLRLNVSKDVRSSFAEMTFEKAAGEIPQVKLRCFVDCGAIVSPSNKLRVTSECTNVPCNGSIYEWHLQKMNNVLEKWEEIRILPNMTSTGVNASNMIIKADVLPSNTKFTLKLIVTSQAGSEGLGELKFKTAGAPHDGYCTQSVNEGVALETKFTFECFDWEDNSKPLSYEFRVGDDPLSYGSSPRSVSTVLPSGKPEDEHKVQIKVIIKNFVGVAVTETLFVKVKPSHKFNPCLTPVEDVASGLTNLVMGDGSELDKLLRKGNISQAAQFASSVMKTANEETACGQGLNTTVTASISSELVEKVTAIKPETLQMAQAIMAVVVLATDDQGERKCDNCADVMGLTINATEAPIKLILAALSDPEEPFSAELEETATSVTSCLNNVLLSASEQSLEAQSSAKEYVLRTSENLNAMVDGFFARLVPSENMVIQSANMTVSLTKVFPEDIKGLSLEEGPAKFQLPENLGDVGMGNLNAIMLTMDFNPYTWDNGSTAIQSSVTSLELQSNNGTKTNISNLVEDIVIVIPILTSSNNNTSNNLVPKHSFLKPNKMSMRSYHVELANVPVTIQMGITERGVFVVKVYIKFGFRPEVDDFDHNFTNTFKSNCDNQTDGKQNELSCLSEETSIIVVPPKPGLIYVGILLLGATNSSEHSRGRRSCFSHGRQRRSCVGVKDPPPNGVTKKVIPQYNPSADVNYTITITQSSCLYWSEDKNKWTSDGCKVDPKTNTTHLICRCNHLTSFGGHFIQAPNPIDFDKVFTEFTNLAESGNISVLVTIACAFLLYFVVLVFARRADKRDENKICPAKLVTIVDDGTYYYDMVICTGVWKNSGTTANVTISIKGEIDEHTHIPLRSKDESSELFTRGSINGFVLITNESLGPLKEITLEHDNARDNPSWFVETVLIRDRQTEEQWTFPINRWLAVEKGDGLIETTAKHGIESPFSDQVCTRYGRKIADSHLWISVFGKASSSTFTRVQRASCCLSVLFSAMIANAMFYNIGGESEGTIYVGPFKVSWRQIVVGIQSGLIVAPVNIVIVLLFNSSKPRRTKADDYKETNHVQQLVDQVKDQGYMLPYYCVYLAWFLCFATTITAGTFTLFYSLMWGKEVAEQWLTSILISNGQDIFILEPGKVMLVVVVISLLATRSKENRKEFESANTDVCVHEIDLICDNPKECFKRGRLDVMRERAKKEEKLAGVMKEIVLHLIFVFFLAIVCYGNKNSSRFMMSTTLLKPFAKFDKVTDTVKLRWWIGHDFLPKFYSQQWYNGLKDRENIYVENKLSILVGMPWMRQLRVKKSSCKSLIQFIPDCYYDYSTELKDTTPLNLPGWKPLPLNTSWPRALQLCPKPWRYQTGKELDNGWIKGTYNTYDGGGYVALLGYDFGTAHVVLSETFGHGWVNRQTRAVILDFAVFNVNTNLLSIATYFYEVFATGAAFATRRVETIELFTTEHGVVIFYLICQFIFITMVFYYFVMLFYHLYQSRFEFFKSVWNMVDFFMIISSVASVVFYTIKSKTVLNSIKSIQKNPYDLVHFHASLHWANLENAAIAIAIFMVTVKLLNLIRFNPYVIYFFSSFRHSVGYQLSYVLIFLILFHGFVISGRQFFGDTVLEYSSYLQGVISQFEFLLGKAVPIDDLRREHPILGPSFVFVYMLTMTIVLMNMIVSVLNESYIDAKTHVEESAEDLKMARFIAERFEEMLSGNKKRPEFRLYCDEATFLNMCQSEAEPNCLNSETIFKCTEERLEKAEKRLSALIRGSEKMDADNEREEADFLKLLHIMATPEKREPVSSKSPC